MTGGACDMYVTASVFSGGVSFQRSVGDCLRELN